MTSSGVACFNLDFYMPLVDLSPISLGCLASPRVPKNRRRIGENPNVLHYCSARSEPFCVALRYWQAWAL